MSAAAKKLVQWIFAASWLSRDSFQLEFLGSPLGGVDPLSPPERESRSMPIISAEMEQAALRVTSFSPT